MNISDFDYILPEELIAQSPTSPRDHSKLLVIDRKTGQISNHIFYNIGSMLGENDVLVLNKTKVFPARFFGQKDTSGKIEVLLIEEIRKGVWKALTKPGLKVGQKVIFQNQTFKAIGHDQQTVILATPLERNELFALLQKYGKTPLPPYIHSTESESDLRKEYQTVYAQTVGSVAAPTAGLHFTKTVLDKLKEKGVQIEYVTLHVGLGTFAPVKTEKLEDHPMHSEYFELDRDVADRLNTAKKSGKRIVSVGSTSTRVLETCSNSQSVLAHQMGETKIFIYPGYKFKFVDALITNFHLPKSTLLAMVSAFVTYPNTNEKFINFKHSLMGKAYAEAIKNKYRFFSFGDASFIF